MRETIFKIGISAIALIFVLIFCIVVIPPLIDNPDILGAFAAGFVNPFSTGYSVDVFCCWGILLLWIIYEAPQIKYGWICVLLGIVPGVAVGFALYLLIRQRQLKNHVKSS